MGNLTDEMTRALVAGAAEGLKALKVEVSTTNSTPMIQAAFKLQSITSLAIDTTDVGLAVKYDLCTPLIVELPSSL